MNESPGKPLYSALEPHCSGKFAPRAANLDCSPAIVPASCPASLDRAVSLIPVGEPLLGYRLHVGPSGPSGGEVGTEGGDDGRRKLQVTIAVT